MHRLDEIEFLLGFVGVTEMTDGYHTAIRAIVVDCSPVKPHGIDYGLQLMGPDKVRVLGFDNSHAYTGAPRGVPYDHEHRVGISGLTYGYHYRSTYDLVTDFYKRVEAFVNLHEQKSGVRLLTGLGA